MGAIDGAVLNGVIASEPQLQKVLHPFLNDFDISWGAKRAAFNATLYQFIAKPSAIFSETFGLEFELLLIYSPYDSMQARMLMYGKEASNRKQEIDRQHYTIPNQRPKDKHCGKI